MAMAYGRTAKVSDAAKRTIGPDDPKARAEVEAKRNQEFDVWDQIGMTADMLPGGAIAAGGAKAAKNLAEAAIRAYDKAPSPVAGSTFYTGMQEAMKVVARISKGSKNLLEDAIKMIDETLAKQEKGAEAENAFLSAKKAIEAVLDGTFDLARKKKGAKHREALSHIKEEKKKPLLLGQDWVKESKALHKGDTSNFSALELVKDLQAKASKVLDISDPMNLPSEDILSRAGNFMGKGTYDGAEVISKLVDSVSVESISKALSEVTEVLSNSKYWKVLNKTDVGRKRLNFLGNIKNMLSGAMQNIERAGKKGVKISDKTTDVMATKDLPASTRMRRDMPSPSAASRVSKEGLQDIKDVRSLDDKELLSIYDEMKDAPFPSPDIPLEFSSADEWDTFLRLMKNEIRDRGLF